MKTILLLSSLFKVCFADAEDGQFNYMLKTTQNSQEYLVAFNSKSQYVENSYISLSLKVECESAKGLTSGAIETPYNTNICIVLEEK